MKGNTTASAYHDCRSYVTRRRCGARPCGTLGAGLRVAPLGYRLPMEFVDSPAAGDSGQFHEMAQKKQRFVGSVNLECSWFIQRGRCAATIPFGILKIEYSQARLGAPLLRFPWVTVRAEVARVFRSRGFMCWGVGFRLHGEVHYFFSFTPAKVLQALIEAGFEQSSDESPNLFDLVPGSGMFGGSSGMFGGTN